MSLQNQSRIIRIPSNIANNIAKIKKVQQSINNEDSDEIIQISEHTGLDKDIITDLLNMNKDTVSLNSIISRNDDTLITINDIIYDEDADSYGILEKKHISENLISLIDTILNEKESTVIKLRYGLEDGEIYSLFKISKVIGLTRQRVKQLEESALNKLRNNTELRLLAGNDNEL